MAAVTPHKRFPRRDINILVIITLLTITVNIESLVGRSCGIQKDNSDWQCIST